MRLPILFALLTATAAAAAGPGPSERAERRAAQLLADKTPGKPQSCINLGFLRGNYGTVLTRDQIIYEETSRKLYVNRPPGGCPELRSDRYIVTVTPGTQLCSGDIVRVRDSSSPIEVGSCSLGEFVPYERVGK